MIPILRKAEGWLGPIIQDDDDQRRIARLTRLFLLVTASLTVLRGLRVIRSLPQAAPFLAIAVLTLLACLALLWSQRLGRVKLTAYLTAAASWLAINSAAGLTGGVDQPIFATNMTVLIFVALTLGARVTAGFALGIILAGAAMIAARLSGLLPTLSLPNELVVGATTQLTNVATGAIYLGIAAYGLQQALSRARQNALTLAERNQALNHEIAERREADEKLRASEQSYQSLYFTASRQAQELALLDQVRTALAREVELPTLMRTVVEAVATAFRYSHVSIYLLEGDTLIMQHEVGYGEQAIPRIPVTQGIAGKVASSGQPVLLKDVRADPAYVAATDEVVSEVCVPLLDQGQVAGIFNVESTGDQRLGEADLRLMQALSEHITIALQRARLLAQTQASEKRFRAMVEHSADAIALIGPDGSIQYRSPAAMTILGRSGEEIAGRKLQEWLLPDDQPVVAALLGRILLAPSATGTAEVRFQHNDGRWLWIEGTATNLLAEPSVQAIVVNYRDITERKQAERSLHESEERFRRLSEVAFEGIVIHHEGIVLDANQAFADLVGFSRPEDLIGKNGLEVLPFAAESLELIRVNLLLGEPKPLDIIVRRPDGSTFPAETQGRDMVLDGRLVRVVAMRDITGRKQAEATLQETRAFLQQALDTFPGMIFIVDELGQVMFVNRYAAQYYGTTPEALVAQSTAAVHRQSGEAQEFVSDDLQVIRTRTRLEKEELNTAPNGEQHWFHTIKVPFVRPDGRVEALGIATDITEQKRAEAELRRRLAEREAVAKVSTALRAAETLEDMLPLLLDETLAVLNTTAGSIFLYNPATDDLRQAVGRGWFAALAPRPQKTDEGIAGLVFTSGAVYRSSEFASDPRVRASARAAVPAGWGGACVPIRSARQVVGAIFVAVEAPRELLDDEARLLTTLAEIAGSAIHRTRLHEQTERNLQRVAALRTIDLAIVSNFDLKASMQVLLGEAVAHIGADAAAVWRFNPRAHRLDLVAGHGFRTPMTQNTLPLETSYAGQATLERRAVFIPDLRETPAPGFLSPLFPSEGFVAFHGLPLIAKGQVKGVLEIFQRSVLAPDAERMAFLEALAGQAAIAIENAQLFEDLQWSNTELVLAYDATIEGWSRTLDVREHDTADHTRRVTDAVLRLARAIGLPEDDLVHLRRGALLHDIGKMSIPDTILLKPGPLTPDEWSIMRQHPQVAFELLFPITFLRPALDIPYSHHEKWNGAGYPRGLKQQEIPLAARMFAVVDVWDALRFDRPYRQAWPEARVLDYLREQSGQHFDPEVVTAFLRLLRGQGESGSRT